MKNQGLPRGVCTNLDFIRQDTQTLPGVYKSMYVIADVQVLIKYKFRNNLKDL